MTVLPPPRPPVRPTFYVYAIVDVTADPPEILGVEKSRRDAKEKIKWRPDADNLRVRRGRLTLYQS